MIAYRVGLFDREGLRIELKQGTAADSLARVSAGEDAIGIADADQFLIGRAAGAPIVAFAGGYVESPVGFYTQEKSGIRTPYDFVGKRIGYIPSSDTALIYDAMMVKLGLPRGVTRELPSGADPTRLAYREVDVWPKHVGADAFALQGAGVATNGKLCARNCIFCPGKDDPGAAVVCAAVSLVRNCGMEPCL
jgi:NitT/TauT family transport system substrate-binding protein